MNAILRNAEAIKEYQSTLGEDNATIESARKEEIFNELVSGATIKHYDAAGNQNLFNYENIFDLFLAESDFMEFNELSKAVQELRMTLNEVGDAKGETAKAAAFNHLLQRTADITNIIDKKANSHIDEYYEEICHHQDSGIDYAA